MGDTLDNLSETTFRSRKEVGIALVAISLKQHTLLEGAAAGHASLLGRYNLYPGLNFPSVMSWHYVHNHSVSMLGLYISAACKYIAAFTELEHANCFSLVAAMDVTRIDELIKLTVVDFFF